MVVYPAGKVQLSYSERKNANGEVLDTSMLVNIRSQDPDDCVELYHEVKRRLESVSAPKEKLHVKFNDEPDDNRSCPECRSPLRMRVGKNGMFMGCSGWPRCRHTERA